MIPRVVGFKTEVEREFFDYFCSVDGVGVKKSIAGNDSSRPRSCDVDRADKTQKGFPYYPGIGPATSERIIAKLRRKMPKFALIAKSIQIDGATSTVDLSIADEVMQLLCSLGHSDVDAQTLVDSALASKKKFKDVESMMQAVYERSVQ